MITVTNKSKFTGKFYASIVGAFGRSGSTKIEAKKAVEEAIMRHAENMHKRKYFFTNDGVIFCFYYNDGWQYDIIYYNGGSGFSTVQLPVDMSEEEALKAMLRHMEQFGGINTSKDRPTEQQQAS